MTAEDFQKEMDEHRLNREASAAPQAETLRDYFAGQALAGLSAINAAQAPTHFAKASYLLADAMLEARKVTK
jgi:hypothetical protein